MSTVGPVVFAVDPRGVPQWMVVLSGLLKESEVEVLGWVERKSRRGLRAHLAQRLERAVFPGSGVGSFVPARHLGGRAYDAVPIRAATVVCANHAPVAEGAELWAFGSSEAPFVFPGPDASNASVVRSCLWRLDGMPRVVEELWTRRDPQLFSRTVDETAVRWATVAARTILKAASPRMGSASVGAGRLEGVASTLREVKAVFRPRYSSHRWSVAYQLGGSEPTAERLTHLVPPPDRLWADPFPFEFEGDKVIFLEEALHGGRGKILACRVHDAERWESLGVVLEGPHHLSYPQIIEDDGRVWMIPECAERGEVRAHRCLQFPDQWDPEGVLLVDGRLADATVYRGRDAWWMWATLVDDGNPSDGLVLYSSDSFEGPWRPHPQNPVRVDVRRSRPAGSVWTEADGTVVRVAQDCAARYGEAVVIQEVESMVPYRDRDRMRIDATRFGANCIHTLNRHGDLWALDLEGLQMGQGER